MTEQERAPAEGTAESALERFAREIAHDLRNHINNLGLNVQQLELTLDLSDPMAERAIERMRCNLQQLAGFSEQIVARARGSRQE